MNLIFVDASFWIAFRDRKDPLHERALELGREVWKERRILTSTPFVFAEIHAYFSRFKRLREQLIVDFWEADAVRMESVGPAEYAAALDVLRSSNDKTYSFCDAISFAVMRRLDIRRALSFDHHFRQVGEFEIIS